MAQIPCKNCIAGNDSICKVREKYTSINISNFFGDFRVGKNILKKSEKTDAQKCFTDEERIRILKLVDKKPDIRNLAIHLCFQTGVRVGELAALKWEDIDWENGTYQFDIQQKAERKKQIEQAMNY